MFFHLNNYKHFSNSLDNTPSSSLEAVAATALSTAVSAPLDWQDSEDECLGDEDWASQIAAELLQTLSDAEKKRQEIINGKVFPRILESRSVVDGWSAYQELD